MRVLLIIIVLPLLFSPHSKAQSSEMDSLRSVLASASSDTARFRLIAELANEWSKSHPDSALLMINAALPQAQDMSAKSSELALLHTKGLIYSRRLQKDSAILLLIEAEKLASALNDQKKIAQILRDIGWNYNDINQKSLAIDYLKRALAIAKKLKDGELQFVILNNLGSVFSYQTQYDSADHYLNKSLELQRKLGNKQKQAGVFRNLGNNAARSADLEKAMNYYEQALLIMQEIDDKKGESIIYRMIGFSYSVYGYFPQALEHYQKALTVLEELGNQPDIAHVQQSLGEIYTSMEDFTQAMEYYERAFAIWEGAGSEAQQIDLLQKRGSIHLQKKEFATALTLFNQSLKLIKSSNQNLFIAELPLNIGICHEQLNQLDSAVAVLQTALDIATKSNDFISKSKTLAVLGKVYHRQGNNSLAIATLEAAMKEAGDAGNKENEMDAAQLLYEVYKNQNNYAQALRHHEVYRAIQDSLFNEKNVSDFARMEANYTFEKERQELAFEKEKEVARQRYIQRIIAIALGIVILIAMAIAWYYRLKQKANAQLRKLNEELLQQKTLVEEQNKQLAELDEMKSRFFTNISHEFRTPLTVIAGMANKLIKQPERRTREAMEMFRRNSYNLLNLVNQILDLRKLESGRLQVNLIQSDVVVYLRYIFESFHSLAQGKKIQAHFLCEEEAILMDYDPEKLLRILSNLLSNAIRFTPEGGDVYVMIRRQESGIRRQESGIRGQESGIGGQALAERSRSQGARSEERGAGSEKPWNHETMKQRAQESGVRSQGTKGKEPQQPTSHQLPADFDSAQSAFTPSIPSPITPHPSLLLQIKDTGIGIPAEKLPHIFNRFYQVDDSSTRAGEGTGIGLALCKELVKLLGGEIKVSSKVEQGTVFTVTLPITREAPFVEQPDNLNSVANIPMTGTTARTFSKPQVAETGDNDKLPLVLLIEDNEDVIQYLIACLAGQYNIATAQDGEEGIERAIELIPDVIVSDVMMPKKDGFAVCDTLKKDKRTSHIPIILLTAKADAQSRISGLQKGADDYLTKPFNEEELQIRLQNLLDTRQKLQEYFQSNQPLPTDLPEEVSQEDEFIQTLKRELEAHLDEEDFGILQLCRAVGMSRSQLHRKIKALTGRSTSLFIRSVRLQKAKTLLETTNLNISQVAYEVGFRDPTYFSRTFAEEFGVNPRESRK